MTDDREIVLGAWVDGPRWMDLPSFIKRTAATTGVELQPLTVKKRWFYVKIHYTASGPRAKVQAFRTQVDAGFKSFGALEQG